MAKKKWKKKIGKALTAAATAYAASKMMGKSPVEGLSTDKFDMTAKPIYRHDLEDVAPKRFGIPDRVKSLPSGTQSGPKTWRDFKPDWWPWNKGGAIKAYQGQLVKSETRGTGAAVKGTTHEVMPGMNAAKKGKMIKANRGTEVRTRGSNPDSSWTTQGGEVKVATKLNGVLTTRTW